MNKPTNGKKYTNQRGQKKRESENVLISIWRVIIQCAGNENVDEKRADCTISSNIGIEIGGEKNSN